jgi:hypothetical protein
VAELLRTLLPYWRGCGVDARWAVVRGTPPFFRVTKRLHNWLHGSRGDGGDLGAAELALFDRVSAWHADALAREVAPGDVVLLQDPQTAPLVASRIRQASSTPLPRRSPLVPARTCCSPVPRWVAWRTTPRGRVPHGSGALERALDRAAAPRACGLRGLDGEILGHRPSVAAGPGSQVVIPVGGVGGAVRGRRTYRDSPLSSSVSRKRLRI